MTTTTPTAPSGLGELVRLELRRLHEAEEERRAADRQAFEAYRAEVESILDDIRNRTAS
jgi:hypothetical protein